RQGGLNGTLSLDGMDVSMEVLRITAPEDNLNALTMNPTIQAYKKLEEVHITRSNIPNLGTHFFWGLNKLEILNLSQNNITQPLDHNFRGLYNLRELYLDDNKIYSLPSGTFRYLTNLVILSIQRNRMHEMMPRVFQQLEKLKVLKLSGNSLVKLNPEIFKDIEALTVFECRGCAFEEMDSEIYSLVPYLIHLDLSDNNISHLNAKEFQYLTDLKSLNLDGNRISAIPADLFSKQSQLTALSLARNSLNELSPMSFVNLKSIVELDLSFNKLEHVDATLLKPVEYTLERLVLSGNHIPIGEIRDLLRKNQVLKVLEIADCGLQEITESVLPEKLSVLSLAGNYLTKLSPDVLPQSLAELDLSRNHFRGLEEEIMQRIETMSKLKLDSNPWTCDLCHIRPLLLRANRTEIYSLKCASPYHYENKLLGTLHRSQLNWCTAPIYTSSNENSFLTVDDGKIGIIAAGASVALLVLIIFSILAAFLYSKRHAAKYYTHEEKRTDERESIFENQSPLFGEELSFKFPMDTGEKKVAIATIDEIKNHALSNGT
ncbi:hypothetical protein AMK59_2608, partial [Oryctes borbonicus]